MAKRRTSNPAQGDLFEMLMAEMANPGLLAGGGGQADKQRRQFLAMLGMGEDAPKARRIKRAARGLRYRAGRSAGEAPLKPARRNKGVGKESAGKQKPRPVTGPGVMTSPVDAGKQMVVAPSQPGPGPVPPPRGPQGPPRPPATQGPPRPPAGAAGGAAGAAGGAAGQATQLPPDYLEQGADKKDAPKKKKGLGSKLMKGMGWMMFGMMLGDLVKQMGGQTEGARAARMSPYMMGGQDQLNLGTPDDLQMSRDLASIMGANADMTKALGPNIDMYL